MSLSNNFPAIKPSLMLDFANTKQLDPRITFTRATTATYYDGVTTAKAEENLIVNSSALSDWTKYNSTATADTSVAPDGTTTADTLTDNATNSWHMVERLVPISAGVYTYSAYIKAGTLGFGCVTFLVDGQGIGLGVVVNLSTGAVTSTLPQGSSTTSHTVTSVGNGWYRVSVTVTSSSNTAWCYVAASNSGTPSSSFALPTYVGSGGTILMWGAQLEQRASATVYTPTTTQPITNYIPVLMTAASGVPRFDHNPTTDESLGLLIEEQRTNIVTYSAQFDSGAWNKDSGISVTANQAVAPDGTIAMDLMTRVPGSLNSWAQLTNAVSVGTGGNVGKTYSFSVWVQALPTAGTVSGILTISDVFYNSYTQAFTATTTPTRVSIIASGGSGWNAAGSLIGAGISLNSNNTSVLVWGAQLEAGAFPTSYIPTVAATVTRNADAASMTGTNFSSWYNAGEGTLTSAYRISFTSGNRYLCSVEQNNNNYVEIGANNTGNRGTVLSRNSGTLDVNITGTTAVSLTNQNIMSLGMKTNDFAYYLNNMSQGTDTSCILSSTLNSLEIGRYNEGSPGGYLNGTISKLAYYPLRVTNTQLQALTS